MARSQLRNKTNNVSDKSMMLTLKTFWPPLGLPRKSIFFWIHFKIIYQKHRQNLNEKKSLSDSLYSGVVVSENISLHSFPIIFFPLKLGPSFRSSVTFDLLQPPSSDSIHGKKRREDKERRSERGKSQVIKKRLEVGFRSTSATIAHVK